MSRPPDPVPRLATVWCPAWSLYAAGVDPAAPAAVVHAHRVLTVSGAAAEAGVRPGLRRREAQARCPQLLVVDHDPDRDARRFEPVARAVAELVPSLELTEPGVLTFATRGPSRYVGGDEPLTLRVHRIVADQGVTGQWGVGIADGRFAAGIAARRAVSRDHASLVVPRGPAATAAFLAPIPVRALHEVGGVPIELVGLLERLGLRQLGQVAGVPAADLVARFGGQGAFAGALASGGDPRLPGAQPPPRELVVARTFDDPVQQLEPLGFVARQLADELQAELRRGGLVATRLLVEVETDHGERSERAWYRPAGLSVGAMVDRVRWQLEGWANQPGNITAGVVLLRLTPSEVRGDRGRQLDFWGGVSQADEWAARAIARVTGLLGDQAVQVPVWRGARDPGQVYGLVPAGVTDLEDRVAAVRPPAMAPPWPGRLPAPSPTQVFAEPIACMVLDGAGAMVGVGGRGSISASPAVLRIEGPDRRADVQIVAWAGPWPVEERWWDPISARRRARFQLLLADGRACLVAIESRRWHLVAWYE